MFFIKRVAKHVHEASFGLPKTQEPEEGRVGEKENQIPLPPRMGSTPWHEHSDSRSEVLQVARSQGREIPATP